MNAFTLSAEIQKIIERDAHSRAMRNARTYRWRDNHPDEYREKMRVYMNAYNERKRAEKATDAQHPEVVAKPKKTRISAKMRKAMAEALHPEVAV